MPNKVIGQLLASLQGSLRDWHQSIADSINYAQLGELESPFDVHPSVEFRSPKQIRIGRSCSLKPRSIFNGRSDMRPYGIAFGPDTYIKEDCYFDAYGGFIEIAGRCGFAQGTIIHGGGGVTIGSNVITGAHCYIIASNHRFDSPELPIMLQGDRRRGIRIGNNVWLGGHVAVLDGVVIGDNSVIGAGTVVTKSVAANTVVFDKRVKCERKVEEGRVGIDE